jgi:hypothetical protein
LLAVPACAEGRVVVQQSADEGSVSAVDAQSVLRNVSITEAAPAAVRRSLLAVAAGYVPSHVPSGAQAAAAASTSQASDLSRRGARRPVNLGSVTRGRVRHAVHSAHGVRNSAAALSSVRDVTFNHLDHRHEAVPVWPVATDMFEEVKYNAPITRHVVRDATKRKAQAQPDLDADDGLQWRLLGPELDDLPPAHRGHEVSDSMVVSAGMVHRQGHDSIQLAASALSRHERGSAMAAQAHAAHVHHTLAEAQTMLRARSRQLLAPPSKSGVGAAISSGKHMDLATAQAEWKSRKMIRGRALQPAQANVLRVPFVLEHSGEVSMQLTFTALDGTVTRSVVALTAAPEPADPSAPYVPADGPADATSPRSTFSCDTSMLRWLVPVVALAIALVALAVVMQVRHNNLTRMSVAPESAIEPRTSSVWPLIGPECLHVRY